MQVLRVQRFYNNQTLGANIVFQLLMALSSQMIGYTCVPFLRCPTSVDPGTHISLDSLAGLTRRFLVYPSTMIWYVLLLLLVTSCSRN